MRIFYNVLDGRLDPAGDASLRAAHFERPFDFGRSPADLPGYVELVSRPYVLCKLAVPRATDDNDDDGSGDEVANDRMSMITTPPLAALPVGAVTQLLFARPPRSKEDADQPSVPFDLTSTVGTAEPIVVFDDATLVPLLLCRVVAADVPRSGAASGIVSVVKEASE